MNNHSRQNLRVLIAASAVQVRKFTTRAMASMGWSVAPVALDRHVLQSHIATRPDLYVVDADDGSDELHWLLTELRTQQPDALVIALANNFRARALRDMNSHVCINHVITKESEPNVFCCEQDIITICHKIQSNDIFGLEKYLTTQGLYVHEQELRQSNERGAALADLEKFLRQLGCRSALQTLVTMVADELLTNAIFNAPRDAEGRRKYAAINRKENVILGSRESVQLRYACDGRLLAISAIDQFGALTRDIVLRHLKQYFTGETPEIATTSGGAGLGLHMVFGSASKLIVNVDRGVKGELIALFCLGGGGMRTLRESGRALNLFSSRTRRSLAPVAS